MARSLRAVFPTKPNGLHIARLQKLLFGMGNIQIFSLKVIHIDSLAFKVLQLWKGINEIMEINSEDVPWRYSSRRCGVLTAETGLLALTRSHTPHPALFFNVSVKGKNKY